jgi:hypothetical protein
VLFQEKCFFLIPFDRGVRIFFKVEGLSCLRMDWYAAYQKEVSGTSERKKVMTYQPVVLNL